MALNPLNRSNLGQLALKGLRSQVMPTSRTLRVENVGLKSWEAYKGGVQPSRLIEVYAHIFVCYSSITRRTSTWCWSALKCGQLATLSPLTLVTNRTHWTSLLLTENRISTRIITTTMPSYLRMSQSYRSEMSRTRDGLLSRIPVHLLGSMGIPWE